MLNKIEFHKNVWYWGMRKLTNHEKDNPQFRSTCCLKYQKFRPYLYLFHRHLNRLHQQLMEYCQYLPRRWHSDYSLNLLDCEKYLRHNWEDKIKNKSIRETQPFTLATVFICKAKQYSFFWEVVCATWSQKKFIIQIANAFQFTADNFGYLNKPMLKK